VFKRSPKTLRATSSLLWVEKGGRGRPNPYFEKAGEKYLPKYSIRPEPASAPTKRAAMLRWILDGTAARRSGTTVGVAEIDVADRWSIDTQYERSLFAVEEPS
jgi:hypothetical protein